VFSSDRRYARLSAWCELFLLQHWRATALVAEDSFCKIIRSAEFLPILHSHTDSPLFHHLRATIYSLLTTFLPSRNERGAFRLDDAQECVPVRDTFFLVVFS
jgi:hypothetical protein